MITTALRLSPLLLLLASASFSHAALVSTINPLGRTAAGVTSSSGNLISSGDMQTLITNAGNTALAGVFDNEGSVAPGGNITTSEPAYSAAGITIGGMTRYGRTDFESPTSGSPSTTQMTSGARPGFVSASETWTLAAKTPGYVISEFGAFFNHIGNTQLSNITVTFTDNSTFVYTSAATALNTGIYEWVGFRAPAGLGIKSLTVTEPSGGGFLPFDDIAYRVSPVPEPAAAGLGLLAIGGMLLPRRRSRQKA